VSWASRSLAGLVVVFVAGLGFGTWMGWLNDPDTFYGMDALAGLGALVLSLLLGLPTALGLLGLVWWLAGPRTSAEEYHRPDRWLVVGVGVATLILGFLIGVAFLGGRITHPWPFGS